MHGLTPRFSTPSFLAVIDPATGAGHYADAGQGLSHILRTDNTIERLVPTGPPLGLMPEQGWDTVPIHRAPGDAILLPTDGLLDLHGGDLGRLTAAMRERNPNDLPETAVKKLCDRRGKRVILDDITAVLLQRDVESA